jgi:hypothetical protein
MRSRAVASARGQSNRRRRGVRTHDADDSGVARLQAGTTPSSGELPRWRRTWRGTELVR